MDNDLVRVNAQQIGAPGSVESRLDPALASVLLAIINVKPEIIGPGREEVAKTLLDYAWTQRLYFVVRSGLMGVLGAIITAGIVAALGTVNAIQVVVIGLVSFVVTLAITRLFDVQITGLSDRVVRRLSKYSSIRDLVVNHF